MNISHDINEASNNDLQNLNENFFNKIINSDKESNYNKELIDILVNLDAHRGHRAEVWNPLMSRYILAKHDGIHIIDLPKTIPLLRKALKNLIKLFSESNARILFVGSKEQLSDLIKLEAERCGQYYVNYRWFGGTLTNWATIQKSIKKMDSIERELFENSSNMNKKEIASKQRVLNKLQNSLAGIRKMSNLPDVIFVTDTKKEKVAIAEANKLGIPVIALLDSNSNPRGVDYPIPCNDDNKNAVGLITQLIADAVLTGMEISFAKREAMQKQRREEKSSSIPSSVKRKSFVRKNESDSENNLEQENPENSENNEQKIKNDENIVDNKKASAIPSQAKLRKSFISPQKNSGTKLPGGGGFSSAASLLKRKPVTTNTNKNPENSGQ